MNAREEKERALHPYPQGELESPFLEEEIFVGETEADWEAHLTALEAESPFRHAFEQSRVVPFEPEEPGEDFVAEEAWTETEDFLLDEVEDYDDEALVESEDSIEEFYDEEESPYAETEIFSDDETWLEEEPHITEEEWIELEEEDEAYPLEESASDGEDEEFEFEDEDYADHVLEEETSDKSPLPVPVGKNPVPFAPPPPMGSYWPVRTSRKDARVVPYMYQAPSGIVGRARRMFLAGRKGKRGGKHALRWHVGVDLFANIKDVVVACEDGKIVDFSFFYKAKSGQRTYRLLIQHDGSGVVVNYGEVTGDSLSKNDLQVGMRVAAGQPIGFVSDTSMLHFETYTKGTTTSHRWWKDEKTPPRQLLNPTHYLLFLREHGLSSTQDVGTQPAPIRPASTSTKPPAELVRFAQRVLNATQGETLAVDGDLGRFTRGALERFRRKHNLGAGGVLDDKTELALAQRVLEEIAQQSIFAQPGVFDAKTEQALITFKSERELGFNATLDAATRAALADALGGASGLATPATPIRPSPAPARIPPLSGPKVPEGFREVKRRGVVRGLKRYGGERVDSKIPELVRLGRVSVPNEDIDTFQRIANVETGGLVQGINTWDSAVVSIGFMQWTLQHGKLQEWIGRAEPAFRRYGIELDPNRKYVWTKNGEVTSKETAIKGASNKDDLRWDGWAVRFFLAGLDDESIAAEVSLAQEHLQRHLNGLRRHLGAPTLFQTFMHHYQASLQIRGVFQAAYNNLPAAARKGTTEALRRAGTVTTEKFLELLQQAILQAYAERNDDGSRIISETRTGARFA